MLCSFFSPANLKRKLYLSYLIYLLLISCFASIHCQFYYFSSDKYQNKSFINHVLFGHFARFLCIWTRHICLVCPYILQWYVIKTGFCLWQRSCRSGLFFISLFGTYTCLLGQWLGLLNILHSTNMAKTF